MMSDEEKPPSMQQPTQELPPARYPFDRVIVSEGSTPRKLTPPEFFALPLAKRIQYVVEQKAAFFAGDSEVDPKEALKQMRKIRTELH